MVTNAIFNNKQSCYTMYYNIWTTKIQVSIVIDILKLALLSLRSHKNLSTYLIKADFCTVATMLDSIWANNSQTWARPCCMYANNRNLSNALFPNIMIKRDGFNCYLSVGKELFLCATNFATSLLNEDLIWIFDFGEYSWLTKDFNHSPL